MSPHYVMKRSLVANISQDNFQSRPHGLVSDYLPFVSSMNNDKANDKYNRNTPRSSPIPGVASNDSTLLFPDLLVNGSVSNAPGFHRQLSYIDKLPIEIQLQIFDHLTQYEVLTMMVVSKAFFQAGVIKLYHNVVVDKAYSELSRQILNLDGLTPWNSSFIKMKYSLKRLLKTIGEPLPISFDNDSSEPKPKYGTFIQKFQFVELPDGFSSPFELNFLSFMSMKLLSRLKHFLWDAEDCLPFDIVERLPNKEHLSTLNLNVDLKKATGKDFLSFRNFSNLEQLVIAPYLNSYNLFQIFKNLLNTTSLNSIKVLRLARVNSEFNFVKSHSTSLLVLTDYILENESVELSDYDMNSILNLFILFSASESILTNLRSLSMDSIALSTVDAKRLSSFIDLGQITYLELKNITELQFPEGIFGPLSMNQLHARLDCGFLISLAERLKNLKFLSIDYRESLRDTVPGFISSLNGLEELDVTIRWNVTKLCSIMSWKELCKQYMRAILKHSSTLKKLSIDTKEDSVFCELHKVIYPESLLELQKLTLLESLRLHGYSLQSYAPTLASSLRNLKYFELFGSGAGGTPHFGLQAVHEGVLDEWLRVQHVAKAIVAKNSGIKFIKLDKCIFEILGAQEVIPREGLHKAFNSKVRVTLQ